jgi:hypothetical protein
MMNGAYDSTEAALQPANDLFYRHLHRPPLIDTLKFPLYF